MTIVEFLLARIAEDERVARAAASITEPVYGHYGNDGSSGTLELAEHEGAPEECIASFARWQPARVLAECAAKQAIVDRWHEDDTCVRILATVYADHPDYDPAWRA